MGEALVDGYVMAGVSIELGPRVRFCRGAQTVLVEVSPRSEGLRCAVTTDRLALAYRAGDTEDPVEPAVGMRLCQALADVIAANEHRVLRTEPAAQSTDRIREVEVTRLLEPMGPPSQRFFALSPYVGCLIGCRFCYAQSRLAGARSLVGLPRVPWGSWLDVRINAAEVLRKELAAGVERPIKFCPVVADPYQAAERRYRVTRGCLDALAASCSPPPTLMLTRSAAILEDIDRIAALPRAWVGVSLPTVDDEVRRHFEPRAATVAERLEVLRCARETGVRTIAVVQPILPGPVNALGDALIELADSVRVDVLRGEEGAGRDFDAASVSHARHDRWQKDSAAELRDRLRAAGVSLWTGELPPELMSEPAR